MKYANCGASTKAASKVKMNQGGFMKIGSQLQKLDVNKSRDKAAMSSGGMAEQRRKEEDKKSGNKTKRGEIVEANKGKAVKKVAFKNCSNCPTKAKCKAAGKCMAKTAAYGGKHVMKKKNK